MLRKFTLLLLCMMSCALSFSALRSSIPRTKHPLILHVQSQNMITQDKYKRLFLQLSLIEQRANKREENGMDATVLRQKLPHTLGLNSQEAQALQDISSELSKNVEELNQVASIIIRVARIEQNKRLTQGIDLIPRAPAELKLLQEQKESLYMQAKEKLQNALGRSRFGKMGTQPYITIESRGCCH